MIFHLNKKTEEGYLSCFNLILDNSQVRQLVGFIKWIISENDFIYTKNDTLSKREVNNIIKQIPNLYFLKDYKIEIDEGSIIGFSLKDLSKIK